MKGFDNYCHSEARRICIAYLQSVKGIRELSVEEIRGQLPSCKGILAPLAESQDSFASENVESSASFERLEAAQGGMFHFFSIIQFRL